MSQSVSLSRSDRAMPEEWTGAEIDALLAARAAGEPYPAIAKRFGRTIEACRTKVRKVEMGWHPDNRKRTQRRPCMCCGRPFPSEHKFNRLCGSCRA